MDLYKHYKNESNDYDLCSWKRDRRRRRGVVVYSGANALAISGAEIIKFTRDPADVAQFSETGTKPTTLYTKFADDVNYTAECNDRLYSSGITEETATYRQSTKYGIRIWESERRVTTPGGVLTGYGMARTKKKANSLRDYALQYDVHQEQAKVQMDGDTPKESVQGLAIQDSDKSSNTIVTRDEAQTKSAAPSEIKAIHYVSSEPTIRMPNVTSRWMPIESFSVTTDMAVGDPIKSYYLPESIFKQMCNAINLLPFEAMLYSNIDIVIKFVVNGHKFQCGKLVASVKFDSYQADKCQNTVNAALNRPHVMLDISTNVEGQLRIPFRYHRSMVRNVKNDNHSKGVRPSKFATVDVFILSKLAIGTGSAASLDIRPFVKFERTEFTGMSYRVKVQMDMIDEVLKVALPNQEVRQILKQAEKCLMACGSTANRDKPTEMRRQIFIPQPRLNFATGKGLSDASQLRMNPYALTSYRVTKPYKDDPKTILDIARIWGLRTKATWNTGQKAKTLLAAFTVDPATRNYNKGYVGTLTPLEYVSNFYQYWSGTIEVRIDFVSTAFHTGAVMLSAEFGRQNEDDLNEAACNSASGYTKTFHLGEQKSVTFTIPYIYDTVWRRNTVLAYQPDLKHPPVTDILKSRAVNIRADSRTTFKVRVVNELRAVQTVSSEIEMLIYWRASPNFMLHSLIQMNYEIDRGTTTLDNFPENGYYVSKTDARRRRSVTGPQQPSANETPEQRNLRLWQEKQKHNVPADKRNEWNEYKAQMDTGDKEAEDTTDDFGVGKFNLSLQTVDSQLSIKDILRRPVLMLYNTEIKGSGADGSNTQAFYIPLMPPSREFQWVEGKSQVWAHTIGQTPQAALMNLFRFWRGSMRYTFIVNSGKVVYVTHMPHTGTRISGGFNVGGDLKSNPIIGSGMSTEIIVPKVNPSTVVEVPYDTENDWTLTFEEDAERNYAWRDKGDTNSGHLVVTSTSDINITVFWSAGDDFEVANFYGIPSGKKDTHLYQWDDAHARVQMDFLNSESFDLRQTFNNIKLPLMMGAVSAIPVVGTPLAQGIAVNRVSNFMDSIDDRTKEVVSKVDDTLTTTQRTLNQWEGVGARIQETIEGLEEQIKQIIAKLTSTVAILPTAQQIIENLLLDIITAWVSQSWTVVGTSIVRVLNQIFGLSGRVMTWGLQLGTMIGQMVSGVPVVQSDDETTMVGLLCGLVGSIMNIVINPTYFMSAQQEFLNIFITTRGVSYLNQVMTFIRHTFTTLKAIILRGLGLVNPEVETLRILSENSELMREFVSEAQICLSEANSHLLLSPSFRTRFWKTTVRAYQIQKALITVRNSNIAKPQLSKLCNDVIKQATERFVDLSCSPVKYEPYVVCIEGEPGIGKSYMAEIIGEAMLHKIGFHRPVSGIMYTRAPGSRFWSTFRDQPIVCYDDWININDGESITQQISELYQLKSTTKFIPEMAHLEEKRIQANPLIVFLVCNDAFPGAMANVALHKDAVYRRRDLVIHARVKDEYKGRDLRSLSDDESSTLAHLEFTIYKDVKDDQSRMRTYRGWDQFQGWYLQSYARYHAQERINVDRRLKRLQSALNMRAEDFLADPFELLYTVSSEVSVVNQNAWTPHEQLTQAVMNVVSTIDERIVREPIVVPERPEDIFTQMDTTLWELVQGFCRGVLSTPILIGRILRLTWEQVLKLLPDNLTTAFGTGTCTVCYEENRTLVVRCSNSTDENMHQVCAQCYEGMVQARRAGVCPVCRNTNFEPNYTEGMGRIMMALVWVRNKGQKYITPLVDAIAFICERAPSKLLALIESVTYVTQALSGRQYSPLMVSRSLGSLTTAMVLSEQDEWADALEYPALTTMYFLSSMLSPPVVQMDLEDLPEIPPLQVPVDQPHIFDPKEVIEENISVTVVKTHPRCLHQELLREIHSAAFRFNPNSNTSEWEIVVREANNAIFAFVEDAPCGNSCPFNDMSRRSAFYVRWREINIAQLRRNLSIIYQGGEAATRARRMVPPIYLPDWAQVDTIDVAIPNDWWNYLSETYDKYKIVINVCVGTVVAVGSLIAINKVWDLVRPTTPPTQADINYNVEARQLRRVLKPTRLTAQRLEPTVQMEELTDVVIEYVARNYTLIKIWEGNDVRKQVTIVGICGKLALLPKHYIKALESMKNFKMTIEPAQYDGGTNHLRQEFTFEIERVTELTDTDVAMIKLPNSYPSFKDIRKFFQTDRDVQGYYPNEALIVLAPTKKRKFMALKNVDLEGIEQQVKLEDVDGSTFYAIDVLKYTHSENGACGSLVVVDKHQRPLRAMHVAGTATDHGYGVLITQELLTTLIPEKVILQYETIKLDSVADREDAMLFDVDCHVDYLGAVAKKDKPFQPRKSKIKASSIQNQLPTPITAPCILTQADTRYQHEMTPLYYGARKHGLLSTNFNHHLVERAKNALWELHISALKPAILKPKRLTVKEAILGIDGVEFYDPMRLNTSAGYPWQIKSKDTTKQAWITVERNENNEVRNVIVNDQLMEEIERKENLRRHGIIPCTMFCDTLKDERKNKEKVLKQGATRVFCASPVDYTIATRQNLLHFCAAFMKARLNINHAVGINAKGPEWTELFNKLTAISPTNIVMMDYSNFGPAFNAVVAEAAVEIMIKWTMKYVQGVDGVELRALLMECVNSVHVANSTVYRQFAGSPSGSAITTIINTLVNLLYIFIVWYALAGEEALKLHTDIFYVFTKHVYVATYGDDFIMAVSDHFKHIFNTNTIRNYLAKYKIVATSAEKEQIEIPDFVTITQAKFLKRGFRPHPTRKSYILGPLESEVVEEIPKWIWETADKKMATRVNVESALLEAHGHGKDYFNKMKEKWNEALSKVRIQTITTEWNDLDEMWFKGTMPLVEDMI